jgi:hypothetical protein
MFSQPAVRTDPIRYPVSTRIAPPAQSRASDNLSETNPLTRAMQMMGTAMSFPRNTEILRTSRPITSTR